MPTYIGYASSEIYSKTDGREEYVTYELILIYTPTGKSGQSSQTVQKERSIRMVIFNKDNYNEVSRYTAEMIFLSSLIDTLEDESLSFGVTPCFGYADIIESR